MTTLRHHATTELREAGERKLAGVVVRYQDTALVGGAFRERFLPGSVSLAPGGVILNVQHERGRPIARYPGGGLDLVDGPEALELRATLPGTREALDTLELVRRGIFGGLSGEFQVEAEREERGVRVIESAVLSGVAVVDRPAYQESTVEARAEVRQDGAGLAGRYPYGQAHVVRDRGPLPRKQRVQPGAFRVTLEDPTREVSILAGRSYDNPLASRLARSVELNDTAEALEFHVPTLPATSWAEDLRRGLAGGLLAYRVQPLYRIPPPEVVPDAVRRVPDDTPEAEPGVEIEEVREAVLTALAVVSRPLRGVEGNDVEIRQDTTRRRRFWL